MEKGKKMISNIKDYIELLSNCINKGVVIYGAGKRGIQSINACNRFSISVLQIADRNVGKEIVGLKTVSVDKLISDKLADVCIISPSKEVDQIKSMLSESFSVLEFDFIEWLLYFFPENLKYRKNCRPFCHYESPYPMLNELNIKVDRSIESDNIKDVDLNEKRQTVLIDNFLENYNEYEIFLERGSRFIKNNGMFTGLDAFALYGFLKTYQPKRIIEIGSGFSTRLMLDFCENVACSKFHVDSIEPDPIRIREYINKEDDIRLIEKPVQEVELDLFSSLQENDILFIDSSHVARRSGDVPYEYFKILPCLRKGVIIHIHDIHWPFEYCDKWIEQGRAYNEIYLLHAFLMNNKSYEVLLYNSMIESLFDDKISKIINSFGVANVPNGSLWIRKSCN